MEEWQPQIMIGLFFVVGIFLSYMGAIFIEKGIERIRHKLQLSSSRATHKGKDIVKRVH
ncbi:hypothetical protein [Marininema halotolerans]|uniref:Uncharacterized protein n=1 Tax=Marininema halotolerans TaxID=1155944 RepID=A0A1I6SM23_9BACL|nr:hypothetical protein [Marininema halotolerans]SFS78012.1 hypothetical protein SAMN05444972_107194 [Marininema halotolerans]